MHTADRIAHRRDNICTHASCPKDTACGPAHSGHVAADAPREAASSRWDLIQQVASARSALQSLMEAYHQGSDAQGQSVHVASALQQAAEALQLCRIGHTDSQGSLESSARILRKALYGLLLELEMLAQRSMWLPTAELQEAVDDGYALLATAARSQRAGRR